MSSIFSVQPLAKQKKRRRKRSSGISRSSKGKKAKGHRQNAAVEGFRGINATDDTDTNLHVEEQTEVEQEESVEAAASYAHNLELKSLRNKVYYQKRKGEQDRQAVALLKEEAKELKDDNIEMAKVNLDCQKMAVKYQAEAEKHLKRLNSRTARFSSYSERKEALVTRVKSEAQRTVQKLTKKHKKETEKQRASHFKETRVRDKAVVVLEAEVANVKNTAAKAVAKVEGVCQKSVEVME